MGAKNDAGEFSTWIDEFIQTMRRMGAGSVPCGECVACCTSSKFVHIRPTDTESLMVIPKAIMFPAPGLSKGHYLLGYDENGYCPMFQEGKCSIYEFRPETCRQYDCRVFAATGDFTSEEGTDINKQIGTWKFRYSTKASEEAQKAVMVAVRFLTENIMKFPEGYIPPSTSQLAAMAIRVHAEFVGYSNASAKDNVMVLVDTITSKYNHG